MIGYICKYVPTAIIEAFDETALKIDPTISNFDRADTLMHPNMCTYIKAVLEECIDKNITEIVLTNCCDSSRRLFDVLAKQKFMKFVHIIDLPRKTTEYSEQLFYNEILKFIKEYENYSGKIFSSSKLLEILKSNKASITEKKSTGINIAILGARCKDSLTKVIESYGATVTHNITCTGDSISFSSIPDINNEDDLIRWYSNTLLNSFPCMRMIDINKRKDRLKALYTDVDGILYHTIKFCDQYSYEYSIIKDNLPIPLLKIETDFTEQSEGQIATRLQAFIESLKTSKEKTTYKPLDNMLNKSKDTNYVVGIDSGSTSTNAVVMDNNSKIISYSVVRTGAKSIEGANKALEIALDNAHLSRDDIKYIIATGYGRVSIPFANEDVTEITCHGKAAYFLNSNIRTIIDIGGQDSKAIRLDDKGNVKDFAMNDKCAAGTGRFLEMMARTLEISIDHMGNESLKWKEDLSITNMCTVFAESEIVSLIAQNKEKADIIHGLNKSISSKTASLVNRIGKMNSYMMTGGVAKNIGVVKSLEEKLGEKIFIPEEPQIVGAIGAALIALEKL